MRRLTSILRDDRGQALVLAVGFMAILSIVSTGLLLYTSSNSRDSSRSAASLKAYAAAEAGSQQRGLGARALDEQRARPVPAPSADEPDRDDVREQRAGPGLVRRRHGHVVRHVRSGRSGLDDSLDRQLQEPDRARLPHL